MINKKILAIVGGVAVALSAVSINKLALVSPPTALVHKLTLHKLKALPQIVWYVRKDGGTRNSLNHVGQCDGLADVGYTAAGGTGTNLHCAFGDVRWLYDAQDGSVRKWVISGGDKVIIRDGPWRIGHDQGITSNDPWCANGQDNNQLCYIPAPPAGTSAQWTEIAGENCITGCADVTGRGPDTTKITELYGGYGLYHVLDLNTTSFVIFKGLGITRHSQCIQHGQQGLPSMCSQNGNLPADDFAIDGIATFTGLHDVTFQDMWVHGFPDRGVIGPIGGTVTAERMRISYNGMAGWDFDDGVQDASINNPTWNFLDSIIEFSGCNQEYPYTHVYPVSSCYSQSTAGYGDGMGSPPGSMLNINVNNSVSRYNTQDGMDPGHVDIGASTMSVINSEFYGNSGGQFKWGYNFTHVLFQNNKVTGNCLAMSVPLVGTPSTYNTNLSDFCRAGSTMSWNYRDGESVDFLNNTIVSYGPGFFVLGCSTIGGCPKSITNVRNNIFAAYDNPGTYNMGGQAGGPSGIYCQDNVTGGTGAACPIVGAINRSNNTWFGGLRNFTPVSTEITTSPQFVNQPTGTASTFVESELVNFNFALMPGSPSTGQGATSTGVTPPVVVPVAPVITWKVPNSVPLGSILSANQLNAVANTPGSFSYSPGVGTILSTVGTTTLATTFTPTDTVHFTTAKMTVALSVTAPVQQPSVTCTKPITVILTPTVSGTFTVSTSGCK